MEDYDDFNYEPEELDTGLKSEDIKKMNDESHLSKDKKLSIKEGIINKSIAKGYSNTKSNHNNTTDNYENEFDLNFTKELREIDKELFSIDKKNKHDIEKALADDNTIDAYDNNNNNGLLLKNKILKNQDSLALDSARLDMLIENVLNDNDIIGFDNHTNQNISKITNGKNNISLINMKSNEKNQIKDLTNQLQPNSRQQRQTQISPQISNIHNISNNDNNNINITPKSIKDKRLQSAINLTRNDQIRPSSSSNQKKSICGKDCSFQILSNEIELLLQTPVTNPKEISLQNVTMISYLSKLNTILSNQITKEKTSLQVPNAKGINKQKNLKAISIYKKEYMKLEARLKQISDPTYESRLIQKTSQLKNDITYYETENLKLKSAQKSTEVMLSSQSKNISYSTIELKRLEMDYENIQRQHALLIENINKNKEIINGNDLKIKHLQDLSKKMENAAKDTFGVNTFENIDEIQIKNVENEEKKKQLQKKIEVLERVSKANKKRYEGEISKNEKMIFLLMKSRQELQMKLNQNEEKKQNDIIYAKGDQCESYIPKRQSSKNCLLPEIESGINNPLRISKDMVINQLEKKAEIERVKEKDYNNNSSTIGKSVMIKPNFAFTQIKKEDIKRNHIEKKEIKVNDMDNKSPKVKQNNDIGNEKDIIEEIHIESKDNEQQEELLQKRQLNEQIECIPDFLKDDLSDNNDNDYKEKDIKIKGNEPAWLDNDNPIVNKDEQVHENGYNDLNDNIGSNRNNNENSKINNNANSDHIKHVNDNDNEDIASLQESSNENINKQKEEVIVKEHPDLSAIELKSKDSIAPVNKIEDYNEFLDLDELEI